MKNFTLLLTLAFAIPSFAQDSSSPLVSFDDYENLMKTVKEHRKTRLVELDKFNEMSTREGVYILDTRSKEMYDRKHVKGAIHLNFSDFTQANLDKLFPNRNATILIYCNNNFVEQMQIDRVSLDQYFIQDMSFASKSSVPDYAQMIDLSTIDLTHLTPVQAVSNTNQTETIKPVIEMNEVEFIPELTENDREKLFPAGTDSSITLALNIPTYINLYGYGYKNVYELSELISVFDSRIQFEGTDVFPVGN